jgi:hypothetical protein
LQGWVPVGGGGYKERMKWGKYGWIYFVFMYQNRIMKPVETVPRRGRTVMKGKDGVGESK